MFGAGIRIALRGAHLLGSNLGISATVELATRLSEPYEQNNGHSGPIIRMPNDKVSVGVLAGVFWDFKNLNHGN